MSTLNSLLTWPNVNWSFFYRSEQSSKMKFKSKQNKKKFPTELTFLNGVVASCPRLSPRWTHKQPQALWNHSTHPAASRELSWNARHSQLELWTSDAWFSAVYWKWVNCSMIQVSIPLESFSSSCILEKTEKKASPPPKKKPKKQRRAYMTLRGLGNVVQAQKSREECFWTIRCHCNNLRTVLSAERVMTNTSQLWVSE